MTHLAGLDRALATFYRFGGCPVALVGDGAFHPDFQVLTLGLFAADGNLGAPARYLDLVGLALDLLVLE